MAKKAAKRKPHVPVKALRTVAKTTGKGKLVSVETARMLERRYQVLELRKNGCSFVEIATILGCSRQTAERDMEEVFAQTADTILDSAPVVRATEMERYMALLKRFQPLAEAGNLAAAGMVLSVSDRIRKLQAADKPEEKHKAEETGVRVYVGINVEDV